MFFTSLNPNIGNTALATSLRTLYYTTLRSINILLINLYISFFFDARLGY